MMRMFLLPGMTTCSVLLCEWKSSGRPGRPSGRACYWPGGACAIGAGSAEQGVRRDGEEFDEVVGQRQVAEQGDRLGETAAVVSRGADLLAHALHLFAQRALEKLAA